MELEKGCNQGGPKDSEVVCSRMVLEMVRMGVGSGDGVSS